MLAIQLGFSYSLESYFLEITLRIIPTRQLGYFGTVSPLQSHDSLVNRYRKGDQSKLLLFLASNAFTF